MIDPIVSQIKSWRLRWSPPREDDEDLNRAFAETFGDNRGKQVLDYLLGMYLKPIQFIGAPSAIKLGEHNGQQIMLMDILERIDSGTHPMAHQESPSSDDDKPMDARL